MTMNQRISIVVTAICVCSSYLGTSGQTLPVASPIQIDDVRTRGIAGELGVPPGKIVSIHGTGVDGNKLGWKAAEGETFIRADSVDDRKLERPVLLRLSLHRFAKDKLKMPRDGQETKLVGWETGGYQGIVDHEFDYVAGYASTGYRFETEFVVVKSGN